MITRLLVVAVRFYRRWISPLKPQTCRYYPTCSQYAIQALRLHGPLRGSWLTTRRICRCHPWGGHGFDPVPGADPNAYWDDAPVAPRQGDPPSPPNH